MKYVTVEVEVDEDDDARAESVLLELLDEAKLHDERIVDWQVVAIERKWSDKAKAFRGGR